MQTIISAYETLRGDQEHMLMPDHESQELRTTVKLCMERFKRTGEGQDNIVFRLFDWCINCGAEPLAEEVLSYVGIRPTREYRFQHTFVDGYHNSYNSHRLQNPSVKMRTYIWKQVDTNPPIYALLQNHYKHLLAQFNQSVPEKQRGRFIYNNKHEECYALGPSKLVRDGDLNGPPFIMGIALGPNDEELDDDDPYLNQYYWE
jgi:hypothetical protein